MTHLERLQALGLASIERGPLVVYFSRGRESRAERHAARLADVAEFYGVERGRGADTNVAVLDEADWKAALELPYGLSAYRSDGAVLFHPADVERGAIYRVLCDALPEGGRLRDDALEVADLVATHELGHAVQRRYFGIGPPSQWLNELVAWYVALVYLGARAPDSLRQLLAVNRAVASAARPELASLDAFERSQPTGREYARFQALFVARGHDVQLTRGVKFLAELAREFPKAETRDAERLPNAEILRRLERLSPGFEDWASRVGDAAEGE